MKMDVYFQKFSSETELLACASYVMEEYQPPEYSAKDEYNKFVNACSEKETLVGDKILQLREKMHCLLQQTAENLEKECNMIEEKNDNLKTLQTQRDDLKNMKILLSQLKAKERNVENTYGHNILQLSQEMIESYKAVYGFDLEIIALDEQVTRVVINFIDNGNVTNLPATIDIDGLTGKITNIHVGFYPDPQKLLKWVEKNGNLPELITRLRNTMIQYMQLQEQETCTNQDV